MARVINVKKARKKQSPCDKCGRKIKVGMPYKHMSIKTGPRTSRRLVRCADCPLWHVWEYRHTTSAEAARICHEYGNQIAGAHPDDLAELLGEAASEIRELAEAEEEKANNIEQGFGHTTYQSEELMEKADSLNAWAEELEAWEPDPVDDEIKGFDSEETFEDWADDQRQSARDALDACPL